MPIDLPAWFARIGFDSQTSSTTPSLSLLNALIFKHTDAVPFENLDVLLGRRISLDDDDIFHKVVVAGRGGYCFELNALFARALTALGFCVTPLSARVRVDRLRETTPPRTHFFLRVDLDDDVWFVDVGVGGLTPTCALRAPRLSNTSEQSTPHEPRRFIAVDDGLTTRLNGDQPQGPARFIHQALRSTWLDVCEFTFEQMPAIDREIANWFTSAHPQSHFKNRLVAARTAGPGVRHTLLNRDYTCRRDGATVTTRLQSHKDIDAVLADVFGICGVSVTDPAFVCPGLD